MGAKAQPSSHHYSIRRLLSVVLTITLLASHIVYQPTTVQKHVDAKQKASPIGCFFVSEALALRASSQWKPWAGWASKSPRCALRIEKPEPISVEPIPDWLKQSVELMLEGFGLSPQEKEAVFIKLKHKGEGATHSNGFSGREKGHEADAEQLILIRKVLERKLRDMQRSGEREFVIYAMGLGGKRPNEALQFLEVLTDVFDKLVKDGEITFPSDWQFQLEAFDGAEQAVVNAQAFLSVWQQEQAQGNNLPNFSFQIHKLNFLNRLAFEELAGKIKKPTFILYRYVTRPNRESAREDGVLRRDWSKVLTKDRIEFAVKRIAAVLPVLNVLRSAVPGTVLILEPLTPSFGNGDKKGHFVLPGLRSESVAKLLGFTEGDRVNFDPGIYQLDDPARAARTTLPEALKEISATARNGTHSHSVTAWTRFRHEGHNLLLAIGDYSVSVMRVLYILSVLSVVRSRDPEALVQQLLSWLEKWDPATYSHSLRVGRNTKLMTTEWIHRELGNAAPSTRDVMKKRLETEASEMVRGAMLHDIGKLFIPKRLIFKTSVLTRREAQLMDWHTRFGAWIIGRNPAFKIIRECALFHQEKFDGTGYPTRANGESIPWWARLIAVADTFDAMTSHRSYHRGLREEEARAEIDRASGTQFDPRAVDIFRAVQMPTASESDNFRSDTDSSVSEPFQFSLPKILKAWPAHYRRILREPLLQTNLRITNDEAHGRLTAADASDLHRRVGSKSAEIGSLLKVLGVHALYEPFCHALTIVGPIPLILGGYFSHHPGPIIYSGVILVIRPVVTWLALRDSKISHRHAIIGFSAIPYLSNFVVPYFLVRTDRVLAQYLLPKFLLRYTKKNRLLGAVA